MASASSASSPAGVRHAPNTMSDSGSASSAPTALMPTLSAPTHGDATSSKLTDAHTGVDAAGQAAAGNVNVPDGTAGSADAGATAHRGSSTSGVPVRTEATPMSPLTAQLRKLPPPVLRQLLARLPAGWTPSEPLPPNLPSIARLLRAVTSS
ncbi:hypothetical protein EON68_04685 [archaeon]|nr:MAG: hypothetical protein EON68_04685 [archaeon]